MKLIKGLQKLSNVLEEVPKFYYLSGGHIYRHVDEVMKKVLEERQKEIETWGSKQLYEEFFGPEPKAFPYGICGVTSNLLCRTFFDEKHVPFVYEEAPKSENIEVLEKAVEAFGDSSFMLRIDCTTHSYIIARLHSSKRDFILQSNVADAIEHFSFKEWMNSAKILAEFNLNDHIKFLKKIKEIGEIKPGTEEAKILAKTFSIDEAQDLNKSFNMTKCQFMARKLDEHHVKKNLGLLGVQLEQ